MAELYRYAAFISYSSKDAAFGRRLHRALEGFGIPSTVGEFDLLGGGGKKNRIYPVFRDREELPAGELGEVLKAALRATGALIVVCSPNSAASPWVEKEIAFFLTLDRRDRVFAIIADDAPITIDGHDATTDCFPPIIRGDTTAPDAPVLIAADARRGKDGFRAAWLKLVAGLIGVNAGILADRDRKRRRARRLRAAIAASLFAVAALAGAAWFDALAWRSRLSTVAVDLASRGQPLEAAPFALGGMNVGRPLLSARSDRADDILARVASVRIAEDLGSLQRIHLATENGAALMTLGTDGTWTYHDLARGSPPLRLTALRNFSLSNNGATLVTQTSDGRTTYYDLARSAPPRDLGSLPRIAFNSLSKMGTALVIPNAGGSATYYDLAGDELPHIIPDADTTILSPAGGALIAVRKDGGSTLYNFRHNGAPIDLGRLEPDAGLETIGESFSADGSALVTVKEDGSGTLYDLARDTKPIDLGPLVRAPLTGFQISANAASLVTQRENGTTAYYDLARGGGPRELGAWPSTTLSKDGGVLVAWNFAPSTDGKIGGADNIAYVFDLTRSDAPVSRGNLGPWVAAQLSDNGAALVSMKADGNLSYFDLAHGSEPRSLGKVPIVSGFTLSADGLAVVVKEEGRRGVVYDFAHGGASRDLGALQEFSLSDNGTTLVTLAEDGTVALYDLARGGVRHEFGQIESSRDYALSNDGHVLVVRTRSGAAAYYDLTALPPRSSGAALATDICESSGDSIPPFPENLRAPARSAGEQSVIQDLRGWPWHPCDWRGLLAGREGWAQWWRAVRIRYFDAPDYTCEERTADGRRDNVSRARCARGHDVEMPAPHRVFGVN